LDSDPGTAWCGIDYLTKKYYFCSTIFSVDSPAVFCYNIDMLSKKGLKMNKLTSLDLTNLSFLLKSDEETLREFYDTASDEDIAYALELIRYAIAENLEKTAQIFDVIEPVGKEDPYADANAVLAKFRLK
jgi:hypothetical protein